MVAMMLALALAQDAAREDAVRKLSTQKVSVDFDQVKPTRYVSPWENRCCSFALRAL